jgi:MFS family permease
LSHRTIEPALDAPWTGFRVLTSPAMRIRRALPDRSPRNLYVAGKFGAQVSQNALLAALLLTAGTSGKASIGLSSFFVAMLLPSILLGPLGGAIVDRLGPTRALTVGAAARALALTPAFFLIGSPHLVWVVAALYSTASQIYTPAEFSVVQDVQGKKPGRTYSLLTVAQYSGQGTGILVVAPLLFLFGGQAAVFAGAMFGFFLVAAIGIAFMQSGVGANRERVTAQEAFGFGTVARFLVTDPRALYALVALTLSGIITRVLVISLPGYVQDEVALGKMGVALILLPGIAGIVAGLIWAARSLCLDRVLGAMRYASLGLFLSLFLLAFVDHGVSIAARNTVPRAEEALNMTALMVVPAGFFAGLGMSVLLMSARMALTESAPRGAQGRVHAVQLTMTESILVVPILLAGVATAMAGTRLTLTVVGVLACIVLLGMESYRASRRLAESGVLTADPTAITVQPSANTAAP